MSDDFKDYLSKYKKDPKKEYESKKEKARRKGKETDHQRTHLILIFGNGWAK